MQEKIFCACVANDSDISEIKNIFEDARKFMQSKNNPQWQNGYPYDDVIEEGVRGGNYRVLKVEGCVAAVWSVYDCDEEYNDIEGAWPTDKNKMNTNYLAAHTLAVSEKFRGKGLARAAIRAVEDEARKGCKTSIRMDTHIKNSPMQALLKSFGFLLCGSLKTRGDGDFLCFEKVL